MSKEKMKILFYGDSITDMGRNRESEIGSVFSFGAGYPFIVASELGRKSPIGYEIINRGISGNRIVDLYARIKADVWNLKPDVLSILIGINDIWHEIACENGVDPIRFEKVYSMLIEDTLKVLPDLKIVLLEPFVLKAATTEMRYDSFLQVKVYAKIVKKLSEKYGLYFIPLQEKFDKASSRYGVEPYLFDGVHPNVAGATLIADEWIKFFNKEIKEKQL